MNYQSLFSDKKKGKYQSAVYVICPESGQVNFTFAWQGLNTLDF